ncbi:MAG TPA: nucleotidyltransferase domain-containing protein [Pirellulales bacterium]|nr:nucleotidyltransferase domain-containing protein [Pirellulales bacterium]
MPNGSIDPEVEYVADLARRRGASWPTIAASSTDAGALQGLLYDELSRFTSDDVDLVVFGSLARREWTSGSDVDWTLLIDGQANTDHRQSARGVKERLPTLRYKNLELKAPGGEGVFGSMAFSHEIVNHIGGQADSNNNMTRRILLLLEAAPIRNLSSDNIGPFERIVRQVLNRYLSSDSNFHSRGDDGSRIPRFLLNDIVRYWRTMCVDFAYKDWEQAGRKWALRNIKLRTSRKLLFVSGLFTAFSCFENEGLRHNAGATADYMLKLQGHLLNFVRSTPLDVVVWTLQSCGLEDHCVRLLDYYEQFLSLINDEDVRAHLESLNQGEVYDDPHFMHCREISHDIQGVLREVCFGIDSPLKEFTLEYGVF